MKGFVGVLSPFFIFIMLLLVVVVDPVVASVDEYPYRGRFFTDFSDAYYSDEFYDSYGFNVTSDCFGAGAEGNYNYTPIVDYSNVDKYLNCSTSAGDGDFWNMTYDYGNYSMNSFSFSIGVPFDSNTLKDLYFYFANFVPLDVFCIKIEFNVGNLEVDIDPTFGSTENILTTSNYTDVGFLENSTMTIRVDLLETYLIGYYINIINETGITIDYNNGFVYDNSFDFSSPVHIVRVEHALAVANGWFYLYEYQYLYGEGYYNENNYYPGGGHLPVRHSSWSYSHGMQDYNENLMDDVYLTHSFTDLLPIPDAWDRGFQQKYKFTGKTDITVTDFVCWVYGGSAYNTQQIAWFRMYLDLYIHNGRGWEKMGKPSSIANIKQWSGIHNGIDDPCVLELRWSGFSKDMRFDEDGMMIFSVMSQHPFPSNLNHFYIMYDDDNTDFNGDGSGDASICLFEQGDPSVVMHKYIFGDYDCLHYFAYDVNDEDTPVYGHEYEVVFEPDKSTYDVGDSVVVHMKNLGENKGGFLVSMVDGDYPYGKVIWDGSIEYNTRKIKTIVFGEAGDYWFNISDWMDSQLWDDNVWWSSSWKSCNKVTVQNNTIFEWEITPRYNLLHQGVAQDFFIKAPVGKVVMIRVVESYVDSNTSDVNAILYQDRLPIGWATGNSKLVNTRFYATGNSRILKAAIFEITAGEKRIYKDSTLFSYVSDGEDITDYFLEMVEDRIVEKKLYNINYRDPYWDTGVSTKIVCSLIDNVMAFNIDITGKGSGTSPISFPYHGTWRVGFIVDGQLKTDYTIDVVVLDDDDDDVLVRESWSGYDFGMLFAFVFTICVGAIVGVSVNSGTGFIGGTFGTMMLFSVPGQPFTYFPLVFLFIGGLVCTMMFVYILRG